MERSDAELVLGARGEDQAAFAELFERWFDRVYAVARQIVHDDGIAAEVAQDSFLTIWQQLDRLEDAEKFGGWALRIGRNKALNRLQKEQRSRPMDGEIMTGLHDGGLDDPTRSTRLIETAAISEVRDRQELVWAATAALGERDASLADLLLRHELSPAEIAEEMGVAPNNAHQLLFRLRTKLGDAVANYLLWRNGRPRCAELAGLIGGANAVFDPSSNRTVQRHASKCEICGEERRSVVEPQKLFASVPLLIAPLALKAKAASALEAMGVPVTGPSAGGPGGPTGGGPAGGAVAGGAVAASPWPRRAGRAMAALVVMGLVVMVFGSRTGEIDVVATATTTTVAATSTTPTTSTTALATTTVPSTVVASTVPIPASTPPPPAAPTTSAPPVVLTTTTTVPAAPPEILRFTSTPNVATTVICQSGFFAHRAVWATQDADTVVLSTTAGTFPGPTTGGQDFCALPGEVLTLTASGAGGVVSATVDVPGLIL